MRCTGRYVQAGFSMTELMVGIAILGVVAIMTVPPVRAYRETLRVDSAAEEISAAVRSAQARARSRSHAMILQYTLNSGSIVITDDVDNDSVPDDDEQSQALELDGVTVSKSTFDDDRLIFNSRGRAVNGGTLTLTGQADQSKELRVSPGTGQVKVQSPES